VAGLAATYSDLAGITKNEPAGFKAKSDWVEECPL
jgi:hypothetical protein